MADPTQVADPPSPTDATDPSPPPDPALTQEPSPEGTDPAPGLTSDSEPPAAEGAKAEPSPDDSWRKAESIGDVLKHEAFAVPWKDREEEGYKRGRAANEKQSQQINAQNGRIAKINSSSEAFQKTWETITDAVKAGELDAAEARRFKDDNKEMFDALGGLHQESGWWAGRDNVIKSLAATVEDEGLYTDFASRMNDVRTGVIEGDDTTFYADLLDRVVTAKTKPLADEITELKAKAERLEGEVKQAERKADGGPAPEQATGGLIGLGTQPKNEQEAINWHATGKWTSQRIRAWRQAQAVAAR